MPHRHIPKATGCSDLLTVMEETYGKTSPRTSLVNWRESHPFHCSLPGTQITEHRGVPRHKYLMWRCRRLSARLPAPLFSYGGTPHQTISAIHRFISLLKLNILDGKEKKLLEVYPQYKEYFISFRRLTFLQVISMHIATIKRQFCFMTVMIFLSQNQNNLVWYITLISSYS